MNNKRNKNNKKAGSYTAHKLAHPAEGLHNTEKWVSTSKKSEDSRAKLNLDQPTKVLDQKANNIKNMSKVTISDVTKKTGLSSADAKRYLHDQTESLEREEAHEKAQKDLSLK